MTSAPVRLQLSRRKGFNLQEHSRAINGLEAVNVARPSKWGNQFSVDDKTSNAEAVSRFGTMYEEALFPTPFIENNPSHAEAKARIAKYTRDALDDLRGKNLACWCKPGEPCHGDVLLERANEQ